MQRILVLRGGALGDFIVTLPALALLRQRWPAARIELVGNATAAVLALDARLLDRAHSQHESRWGALYGDAPLSPDFARELAAFDLILNFWPDPDGDLRRRFPLHPAQIFLSAAAHPARTPAAAHYCEPLAASLGARAAGPHHGVGPDLRAGRQDLPPPTAGAAPPGPPGGRAPSFPNESAPLWHRLATPAPDARQIAIHPGSGSPTKNWPLPRWVELCSWLTREHRAELLIITGEADTSAANALTPFGPAARQLPLPDLVARLARCRLFLGHDSGISHLAAACGVPSLLLFGPTDPAMWAPPAPHVSVLRLGTTLDSIPLAAVQAAVDSRLAEFR